MEASLLAAWFCWQIGDVLAILGAAGNTSDGRTPNPGVLWMILLCTTIKQEAIAPDAFTSVFTEGAHLTQVLRTRLASGAQWVQVRQLVW